MKLVDVIEKIKKHSPLPDTATDEQKRDRLLLTWLIYFEILEQEKVQNSLEVKL